MQQLFGVPIYIPVVTEDHITKAIATLSHLKPFGYLILAADDIEYHESFLHNWLIDSDIKIFGGIFPGVIFDTEVKNCGALIVPIICEFEIIVIKNLSELTNSEPYFPLPDGEVLSSLVLVDALTTNIDISLTGLFQTLGHKATVFGGGAGTLTFEKKPCLFTPQGILQDAMVIMTMRVPCVLAVGHGWEILDGPYLANEVDGNTIIQINFQPAMEVYRQVIELHSGKRFSDANFFDIAQTYPFGLDRLDEKFLVRSALKQEGNSLTCVGKVPENTTLYILTGNSSKLIKATQDAVHTCTLTNNVSNGILFNCVSRKGFLKEEFSYELEGIAKPIHSDAPLIGALVVGEIASGVSGCIDFHNKTAVMALVQETI